MEVTVFAVTYWITSTSTHTEFEIASSHNEAAEYADLHTAGMSWRNLVKTKIIRVAREDELKEIRSIRDRFEI